MGKILSNDNRDPHRYDPSPRCPSTWDKRGWRTRAEAEREPCTPMDKAEIEIERLNRVIAEMESDAALERVEELEQAARQVCFSPTAGETIIYVKASALRDLEAIIGDVKVTDENKEGGA